MSPRTYLVTGADSGIGARLVTLLRQRGSVVISCGIGGDVDISADLRTRDGRRALTDAAAARAPRGIDGVALVAGTGAASPATVGLNYFGTSLLPLLRLGQDPRVVVVSSAAALSAGDSALIDACVAGDETKATDAAEKLIARRRGSVIYRSTKIALHVWLRRTAVTPDWTSRGVLLNAVAPGIVDTQMAREEVLPNSASRRLMAEALPQPLGMPGPVEPVAEAVAWLLSAEAGFMTGQILFCDGGADATLRGAAPYRRGARYGPRRMARMIYWALAARKGQKETVPG